MSRDNGKKYPRTIESKNSYLRIRAPEHLDVALEGLIRKVLKEQPKMDDIYAFAADYFDMLLKIREKAGIRKLSVQDICPYHNEEDANDMIKLASTFTKRNKETKSTPRTYRAVSLKHGDHRHERKGMKTKDGDVKNGERFNAVLPIVSEHPELEESKPVETAAKNEKPESDSEENDLDIVQPKSQDPSEKIVEAREVILEEDVEEDGTAVESGITVGDINEINDKIIAVENEIQALESRKNETVNDGNLVGENIDKIKLETEDARTTEAVPVMKEPPQESGDLKPTVGDEITIGEVEEDVKQKEEKASEERAKETGTEIEAESNLEVQESDDGLKSIPQETEALKLDINEHDMQETKNYDDTVAVKTEESKADTAREDMHESGGQIEETEKRPSDEVSVQEKQEEKLPEETSVQEEKPSEEVLVEEEKPSEDVLVAEEKPSEEVLVEEEKPSEEVLVEEEKPSEEVLVEEEKPSEEVLVEEEKPSEDVLVAEEKPSEEVSLEETQEEKPPEEASAQETQEEKPSKEVSVQEVEEEKPPEEDSVEEKQDEKSPEEVSVREVEEEKPPEEATAQEAQEEKSPEEVSVEEKQEENPTEDVSIEEAQEEKPPEEVSVEEKQEENPTEDVSVQEAAEKQQESGVQSAAETDPKEELVEESRNTPPTAELKAEESRTVTEITETESEAEIALEEVKVNDTAEEGAVEKAEDKEENTNNDITEEVYSNKESEVMGIPPTDAAQAKKTELTEGERQKNGKSGSDEFIYLEKQSEGLQNAVLSDKQTEVASTADTATHDIESETSDDTVIINVPENAEKKAPEENYTESNNESHDTGETGLKPAGSGAIAIASGIGAAAAILDHAKRELVDQKSEEITEIEKKTEEADQQSSAEDVTMEADSQREEMTLAKEVETFLNRERQHSSYDNEKEELNAEELRENKNMTMSDVEVMSENIHGSLARMTLPEKETEDGQTPEKVKSGPSDVETEGDDQDRDGSTTSDEIEFEISPLRNTEIPVDSVKSAGGTDAGIENSPANVLTTEENDLKNMEKTDGKSDPIIIQVNGGESEDQTIDDNEDTATEQVKIFLEVPEPIVEEYPSRKVEDAMQQQGTQLEDQSRSSGTIESLRNDTVNVEEEAVIECANVGNEIIQTGEVQKVELIEGDEDILQVHLTTTIETVQENDDSLLVQMTSKVDPIFEVSMETRVNSPVLDEKMRLVKAAVIIQNGFRRFRKRKVTGEPLDVSTEELDTSTVSETKMDISAETVLKDVSLRESGSSFSSSATKSSKGHNLSRSATRTLLETHSLDPIRKITPLKTRSLSTVRYGVADFDVWNKLVQELEEAATKIQSKYRGYKTRKKLQRGNAIQSTTTTSEDSSAAADSMEIGHRHTGEFHDSIVLPLPPK